MPPPLAEPHTQPRDRVYFRARHPGSADPATAGSAGLLAAPIAAAPLQVSLVWSLAFRRSFLVAVLFSAPPGPDCLQADGQIRTAFAALAEGERSCGAVLAGRLSSLLAAKIALRVAPAGFGILGAGAALRRDGALHIEPFFLGNHAPDAPGHIAAMSAHRRLTLLRDPEIEILTRPF